MGVYIDMEMPKDCWHCQMFCNCFACEGYSCHCAALGKDIGGENEVPHNKRRENCPLVSISQHGRLIDADALEKDIDKYIGGEETRSRFHHWVQVQRTVIPESKEART